MQFKSVFLPFQRLLNFLSHLCIQRSDYVIPNNYTKNQLIENFSSLISYSELPIKTIFEIFMENNILNEN